MTGNLSSTADIAIQPAPDPAAAPSRAGTPPEPSPISWMEKRLCSLLTTLLKWLIHSRVADRPAGRPVFYDRLIGEEALADDGF